MWLPDGEKKLEDTFICDGHRATAYRPRLCIASRCKNRLKFCQCYERPQWHVFWLTVYFVESQNVFLWAPTALLTLGLGIQAIGRLRHGTK